MEKKKVSCFEIYSFLVEEFEKRGWEFVNLEFKSFNNYSTTNYNLRDNPEKFEQNFYKYEVINVEDEFNLEVCLSEKKIEVKHKDLSGYTTTEIYTVADKEYKKYQNVLENNPESILITDEPDYTYYAEYFEGIFNLMNESLMNIGEIIEKFSSVNVIEYYEQNGNYDSRYSLFVTDDYEEFEEELNKFLLNNFDKIFKELCNMNKGKFEDYILNNDLMTEEELKNQVKNDYPKYFEEYYQV